jgi:hypothetical protein
MTTSNELLLLEFNYESSQANVISKANFEFQIRSRMVFIQVDNDRFMVYNPQEFAVGSFRDKKIIFCYRKELDFNGLRFLKLNGDKLICFRTLNHSNDAGVLLWQYCKIDLITLKEERIDVPCVFNGNCSIPRFNVRTII